MNDMLIISIILTSATAIRADKTDLPGWYIPNNPEASRKVLVAKGSSRNN